MPDLSFFNPFSTTGSINGYKYKYPSNISEPRHFVDKHIEDMHLISYFNSLLTNTDKNSVELAWELLLGHHYFYDLQNCSVYNNNGVVGAKGLLDLLIFPLISRALYQSVVDHPDHKDSYYSFIPGIIWFVLEAVRVVLAIALVLPTALILSMIRTPNYQDTDPQNILNNLAL